MVCQLAGSFPTSHTVVASTRSAPARVIPARGIHSFSRNARAINALLVAAVLVMLMLCLNPGGVEAQVPAVDKKRIFTEDRPKEIRRVEKETKQILASDKISESAAQEQIDISAPQLEYDKEGALAHGKGGMIISKPGVQVQAEEGQLNSETKDAQLQRDVVFTTDRAVIASASGNLNLETEQGTFGEASLDLLDGFYHSDSDRLDKIGEFKYQLFDATLTTCQCDKGKGGRERLPWRIRVKHAEVEQEGYAHAHSAVFELFGAPVAYLPYFVFPVKTERASGLLVPSFGFSGKDGLSLKVPVFVVTSDSSDLLVSPFLETSTRQGLELHGREIFSRYNRLEAGVVYSNENQRDGSLRGLNTVGIFDPALEEDRVGAYYHHTWTNRPRDEFQWSYVADVNYVNDNLFQRELEVRQLGPYNERFVTSLAVLRGSFNEYLSGELSGEYNQSLLTDQDLVLQRLPEASLSGYKSWRPFGYNSLGAKLVTDGRIVATQFSRDTGYDGTRVDINPQVSVPFHYQNYFNASVGVGMHQTAYELDATLDPSTKKHLDDSQDRRVFMFGANISTAFDRVYELDDDSWLRSLAARGVQNQATLLTRVKNSIEPFLQYSYVPKTPQEDLPLFDTLDRIHKRSLVTYGVKSRLLGRFLPAQPGADPIPEITPRIEDLSLVEIDKPLYDFDRSNDGASTASRFSVRKGAITELASITLKQSYDYLVDKDFDRGVTSQRPFSDLGATVSITPNSYFATVFDTNYSTNRLDFSSWSLATLIRDDRGDNVVSRFTYVDRSITQWEGNVELALADSWKAGFYGRWDNKEKEFIERRIGLRYLGACDCWHVDLGVHDKLNPDKQLVSLSITFKGLGDLAQSYTTRSNPSTSG